MQQQYQKPALLVARALDSVKGSGKDLDDIVDNFPQTATTSAYEADE
jgi:hypothetical protein